MTRLGFRLAAAKLQNNKSKIKNASSINSVWVDVGSQLAHQVSSPTCKFGKLDLAFAAFHFSLINVVLKIQHTSPILFALLFVGACFATGGAKKDTHLRNLNLQCSQPSDKLVWLCWFSTHIPSSVCSYTFKTDDVKQAKSADTPSWWSAVGQCWLASLALVGVMYPRQLALYGDIQLLFCWFIMLNRWWQSPSVN